MELLRPEFDLPAFLEAAALPLTTEQQRTLPDPIRMKYLAAYAFRQSDPRTVLEIHSHNEAPLTGMLRNDQWRTYSFGHTTGAKRWIRQLNQQGIGHDFADTNLLGLPFNYDYALYAWQNRGAIELVTSIDGYYVTHRYENQQLVSTFVERPQLFIPEDIDPRSNPKRQLKVHVQDNDCW